MLSQTVPIPQDWVRGVKFCLFSYNISPHASTGESPFFLLFCRDANFPSEVDEALLPTPYSVDIDDFRAIMMQNIGKAVENVRQALEKERERAKKHYDERNKVNPWKYKPGQRVMVLDPGIGNGVAQKLAWRFFGPFRISEILNNNAKVYPLDKPHADPQLVPLDRLCPIPAEVPKISYARRPDRSRIIQSCTLSVNSSCQFISEIDDALELSLQTVEITDRIVLREAKAGREASVYESDEKKVVLVALLDDSGLGPYSVCSGNCTSRCKVLSVNQVLPSYSGPEAKQAVPTVAHQVFLVELGKYLDEADLPAKVAALLGKSADVLNREFADLVGGRQVSPPSKELIQAQAYLRPVRLAVGYSLVVGRAVLCGAPRFK
ncbi:pol polyprotein [Aphelenchoides avenae]|nr:pol polyprotein [Aphelenchus avenae]